MESPIKDTLKMIKDQGMESSLIKKGICIKDSGKMVNSMEKERI